MLPIFIENCQYLDKDTNAITIGPVVFCKPNMEEHTRNHELIHHQQNIETLYIGMLAIYAYDYIKGRFSGLDPYDAYMSTRAEIEAYDNENDFHYLSKRKRYKWLFSHKTSKTQPKKSKGRSPMSKKSPTKATRRSDRIANNRKYK